MIFMIMIMTLLLLFCLPLILLLLLLLWVSSLFLVVAHCWSFGSDLVDSEPQAGNNPNS